MFFLVLFLLQFNNGVAFIPRPELQDLPLTSGETCQAQVRYFGRYTPTNACMLRLEEDECGSDASYRSQIKDCPGCDCLNSRNISFFPSNIAVMVPKVNPQLVERIQKSNTFDLAGYGIEVSDTLFHVTISVMGITILGLLLYIFPLGLFLVPLGIAWLVSIGISFLFILGIGPEIERSPGEYAALVGQAFFAAVGSSTSMVPDMLSFLPRGIWELPHFFRGKEIEAIEEKVYTFELEDLLYV